MFMFSAITVNYYRVAGIHIQLLCSKQDLFYKGRQTIYHNSLPSSFILFHDFLVFARVEYL